MGGVVGGSAVLVSGGVSLNDGEVVGGVDGGSLGVVSGGGTLVVESSGGSAVDVGVFGGVFVGGSEVSDGGSVGVSVVPGSAVVEPLACRLAMARRELELSSTLMISMDISPAGTAPSFVTAGSVCCPVVWRRCPGHIREAPETDTKLRPSKQHTAIAAMIARRPGEVLRVLGRIDRSSWGKSASFDIILSSSLVLSSPASMLTSCLSSGEAISKRTKSVARERQIYQCCRGCEDGRDGTSRKSDFGGQEQIGRFDARTAETIPSGDVQRWSRQRVERV